MGRARGTVDERRTGVWRLRADAPPDPLTGQRRRVTKTVYVNGKRQAQQELAKLLTELGVRPKRGGTRAKNVADACTALADRIGCARGRWQEVACVRLAFPGGHRVLRRSHHRR